MFREGGRMTSSNNPELLRLAESVCILDLRGIISWRTRDRLLKKLQKYYDEKDKVQMR